MPTPLLHELEYASFEYGFCWAIVDGKGCNKLVVGCTYEDKEQLYKVYEFKSFQAASNFLDRRHKLAEHTALRRSVRVDALTAQALMFEWGEQ